MTQFEKLFDKTFNVDPLGFAQEEAIAKTVDRQLKLAMKLRNWRIGVIKWFDANKGSDGLGYVVTNDFGFERWNKRGSDFVELPFVGACCSSGVPSERSLVVFCIGRDKHIVALRSIEFSVFDFKLVLRYESHQQPIISGRSKSGWQCNIHVLSALLQRITKTDETLAQVREWIGSYLEQLPGKTRGDAINAWLGDPWFGKRLSEWMPDINFQRSDTPVSSQICSVPGKDKSLSSVDLDIETRATKKEESPMNDNVILKQKPASLQAAANDVLHDMYVSKVGNRLNELDSPSDEDRRRWIWELIQNAKDSIAGEDCLQNHVSIELTISDDTVVFTHNGAPFNPKNRLGLLYQYSKDKRNQEGSTGRFGTGFMTTHCLSRVVEVKGDVSTPDEGVRGFSVTIHREGNSEEEMIQGLKAMESSDCFYERPFGKTTYTYHVNSESGRRAIKLGIDEVKRQICKVMCFCPELESVSVDWDGSIFAVSQSRPESVAEGVDRLSFQVQEGSCRYERTFIRASLKENGCELLTRKYDRDRSVSVDVALEVNEQAHSIIGHEDEASVFCVFPVIGIENQLQEPLFVNSPDFELTTERNALYLLGPDEVDNGRPSNAAVNRMILNKTARLYAKLVKWLSEKQYGRLYYLADGLSDVKDHPRLDREWYKRSVQFEYRKALLELKVARAVPLCVSNEWLSLSEVSIVMEKTSEAASKMMRLMADFEFGLEVKPQIEDNYEWAKRVWDEDDIQLWSISSLCKYIEAKGTWSNLPLKENVDKVRWYNSFLSTILTEDKSLLDDHKLLPDMTGELHTKSDKTFEQAENTSQFVIELMKELGMDVRAHLMHFDIQGVDLERKFNSIRYSSEINKLVEAYVKKDSGAAIIPREIIPLLKIMPQEGKCSDAFVQKRRKTAAVLKWIYKWPVESFTECDDLLESAWKVCDETLSKKLPGRVAKCASVQGLCDADICSTEDQAIQFLNCFYEWLDVMNVASEAIAAFPNQHGEFKAKKELYYEGSPIDARIKDFVAKLNANDDVRTLLIDIRCQDKAKVAREMSFQAVCNKLDELVYNGMSTRKNDDIYRNVVRELLDDWIETNAKWFNAMFFPHVHPNYSDLELEVVHTTEERKLANELLRKFPIEQLKALASGQKSSIQVARVSSIGVATDALSVSFSDGQYSGLSDEQKRDTLVEAKKQVMEKLKAEGYEFSQGICEADYSLINGVMKSGIEYPLVVHSYVDQSRPFQLNAADWEQLTKPNSMLMVRTGIGVYSIPFRDLVCNREKIDFSISTKGNLDLTDRMAALGRVMRWFKGLRFDFGSLIPIKAGTAQTFDLPEKAIPGDKKESELSADSQGEVF